MARLQILELPEGSDDDRPPFVLVVDQVPRDELAFEALRRDLEDNDIATRTGARGALVFEDTIDIPANDTSAYSQQAAEETGATIGNALRAAKAQQLADERTNIARDMDRLAKWKDELLDALGMDRTRDWDDIRNAATGIRKQRDTQAEAIERVRQLHRPVEFRDRGIICAECSAWDGSTTDNSPCGYEHCPTLKALNGPQAGQP